MALTDLLARLADCANWDSSGGGISSQRAAAIGSAILDSLAESGDSCMIQPIGSVTAYAGNDLPDGWLWCDGSEHLAADYPLLAAVMTGFFYDDGYPTFTTPDLRHKFVYGAQFPGFQGDTGGTGGASSVTLTETELPAHSHTSPPHSHGTSEAAHRHSMDHTTTVQAKANSAIGNSNRLARASTTVGTDQNVSIPSTGIYGGYSLVGLTVNDAAVQIDPVGDGAPFSIIPPFVILSYIIRAR